MTQWEREPATLWRRSGRQVVLLPIDADDALLVGGVGALVWLLLETPMSEAELVDVLVEQFAADPALIRHELRAFGEELAALGALHLDAGDRGRAATAAEVDT